MNVFLFEDKNLYLMAHLFLIDLLLVIAVVMLEEAFLLALDLVDLLIFGIHMYG
jgi:hypothetical protein